MGCEQSTDANSNSKLINSKVNSMSNSNGTLASGPKSKSNGNGSNKSTNGNIDGSSSSSQQLNRKEFEASVKLKNNSYQGVPDDENKTGIDMLPLETVRTLLQEYKESDEVIKNLEQQDPLTVFFIKNLHLKQIEQRVGAQTQSIDELKKRHHFVGSKKGPVGVKDVLQKLDSKNSVSRDEQELLVKANKFEIATTELEMLNQERSLVENEVTQRFVILSQLRDAYQRQEDIIEKLKLNEQLPEEIPLQQELTELESRRMAVSETYERWKEGKTLVAESCRQFTEARKKWGEFNEGDTLTRLPLHSINYELGEEVRDNLISAWQGLHNAKFYLQCDLPYCTETELTTLQKATSYLFIDLMSEARRAHAESCYVAAHRRTVALLAWVTKVIENMLEPELEKLNEIVQDKIQALSTVRIDYIFRQYPELDSTMSRPAARTPKPKPETDADGLINPRGRADSIPFLSATLDSESLKLLAELNLTHLAALPTQAELFRKTGSENSNQGRSTADTANSNGHGGNGTATSDEGSIRSQSRIQRRKESIDKNLTDLELKRGWSNASGERRITANGIK